jgi:hypothetical protein
MKVKRLDANCRDLKARLKREERALEARMRRDRVAPRGAALLEKIEKLDLRNVGRDQRLQLLQSSRGIHAFLSMHTANLRNRLSFASARNRLLNLIPLVTSEDTAFVFRRSAYWRDYLINCLLDLYYQVAKRDNNKLWMDRINLFKEKWDLADKGNFGKSEIGMQALALLRKLHFYEEFRAGLNRSFKFESKLLAQIRTANPQFLTELSKAKAFREKRGGQEGMTEEASERADFTAYGIMCRLFGIETKKTWKDLLAEIAPSWKDDPRNFQKLLRECLIPFKPAGQWRGQQKCVRKREKNIH